MALLALSIILFELVMVGKMLPRVDELKYIGCAGMDAVFMLPVEDSKLNWPVPVMVPPFQFNVAPLKARMLPVLKLIVALFQLTVPL